MKKVEKLIGLYQDGELSAEEKAFIEEQIELKPNLKDELTKYEHLDEILTKARKIELPVSTLLEERILERIKTEEEGEGWIHFLKGILFAPKKYSYEIIGTTAVTLLIIFAVFRFMPGMVVSSKDEAPVEELEISKVLPSSPEKLDESSTDSFASSPSTLKSEEAADEDTTIVPFSIHEEPEAETLHLGGDKFIKKTPKPTPTYDLEKKDSFDDKVVARAHTGEGVAEEIDNGKANEKADVRAKGKTIFDDHKGKTLSGGEDGGTGTLKKLLFTANDESGNPITLIIYTLNPDKARSDIQNKAIELGVVYRDENKVDGNDLTKERTEKDTLAYGVKRTSKNISIPRGRVRELLTYIESQYPPTKHQIEELDIDEKKSLLNIEFTIPKEED
jgi:putative zinc finger protein